MIDCNMACVESVTAQQRYVLPLSLKRDLHPAVGVLDLHQLAGFGVLQDRLQELFDIHTLVAHRVPGYIGEVAQGLLGQGQWNADLDRLLPVPPDLDAQDTRLVAQ